MRLKFAILLLSLCCLISISCARHVVKNKTQIEVKQKQTINSSDTSSIKTEEVKETTTVFGDTLKASLYFDEQNSSDIVESSGLRIKGILEKTTSGYKVKLEAVAKPVEITERTTTKIDEKKGVSVTTTSVTETTLKDSAKEAEPTTTGLLQTAIISLFILLLIYMLYRWLKKIGFGK